VFRGERNDFRHRQDDEPRQVHSRMTRLFVIITLACVAIASVGIINHVTPVHVKSLKSEIHSMLRNEKISKDQTFLKHSKKAVGDRYLLGVGKGDITGYAT